MFRLHFNVTGGTGLVSKFFSLTQSLPIRIRRALLMAGMLVKGAIQKNLSGPAHSKRMYYDAGSGRDRMNALATGDDVGRLITSWRAKHGERYTATTNTNRFPGVVTGAYRSSWRTALEPGGMSIRIFTPLAYPAYLEFGTRYINPPMPVVQPTLDETEDEVMALMNAQVWGMVTA